MKPEKSNLFTPLKIGSLEMTGETMREFFLTVGVFTLVLFACGLYAHFYSRIRKFPRENSNVAEFCMVLPNNAFMGFPVASTFFGELGLLMMAATNAAMNIYMFSYGVILMDRNTDCDDGGKESAVKDAGSPEEALAILEKVPCASQHTVTVADGGGNIFVAECSPRKLHVIRPQCSRAVAAV